MTRTSLGAVSPCFIVSNAERSANFYRSKLGFEVRFEEAANGKPFFAIVGRDLAQIFLKSHNGIAPVPNHTRHPCMPWDAFLYVEDPDTLAAEFSARGVSFHKPLEDTHDGLRGFEISDLDNYVLFFGQPQAKPHAAKAGQ